MPLLGALCAVDRYFHEILPLTGKLAGAVVTDSAANDLDLVCCSQKPEIDMLIRKLRQDRGLSQEQLAETTRLSLRTIQRAEAGHRVSYVSLRSLAATFEINVDQLERELYAMNTTKDEFIEKPLWVRLILSLPSLSRLDNFGLIRHEVALVAYAIFAYVASFIVPRVETAFGSLTTVDLLYFSAFSALLIGYIASITPRFRERFKTSAPTST